MNALGVYLLVSLSFVIGSMMEFAGILNLQRKHDLGNVIKVGANFKWKRPTFEIIKTWSAKIDGIAMFLFLSSYVLFNGVYWALFLSTH